MSPFISTDTFSESEETHVQEYCKIQMGLLVYWLEGGGGRVVDLALCAEMNKQVILKN